MHYLQLFFEQFFKLTYEMSPYLLFGFLIAGLLKVYLPARFLNRYLGRPNFRSVLNGTLFGIPLPLCSCGVIPTGVSLYQNGASRGATQSFFISTPQTGVDSVMVTWSLLGFPFALIRPVVAFITGIAGGVFTNWFDKKKGQKTDHAGIADSDYAGLGAVDKLKAMLRYAFVDFVADIAKWLVIGLLLAALISVVVPDGFFAENLSNPWLAMLFMLAVSLPVYACSTGSVPVAAVLLMKGINPGAILVFLMAGPATNVATMTVIANTIGRRFLIIYLLTIIAGALFFGFIIDSFLPASWFMIAESVHGQIHFIPEWFYALSTLLIGGLLLFSLGKKWWNRFFPDQQSGQSDFTVRVGGMTCQHCQASVYSGLSELEGVTSVHVDLASGVVHLEGKVKEADIKNEITRLGYQYKGQAK